MRTLYMNWKCVKCHQKTILNWKKISTFDENFLKDHKEKSGIHISLKLMLSTLHDSCNDLPFFARRNEDSNNYLSF